MLILKRKNNYLPFWLLMTNHSTKLVSMNHKEYKITFKDGNQVQLNDYKEQSVNEKPIILILPAMGVKASYYRPFIEKLLRYNFHVCSVDLRGLGTFSTRPSAKEDWGYAELVSDLFTVIDYLKGKYHNKKIYCLGHSLGGQIASLSLAKNPQLFDGLILTASNSVYYKSWEGKSRMAARLSYLLFPRISNILGYFPGDKIGFGGRAAKTQIVDWAYAIKNGRFKLKNDAFDYESNFKKIKKPILTICIEGDWLSPKKAIDHLCQKFGNDANIHQYTLSTEEAGRKLDHFNWVKYGDPIPKVINEWLQPVPIQS
jgi:predicted alpha/beta hydrolase